MKTNIRKVVVLWAVLTGLILALLPDAHAQTLQPRLLWEKKLPFKGSVGMARISGDVLVLSQDARQIILYDQNGKEVFHWGPRVDRQPLGADISDDGSVIIYKTGFTESYLDRKKPTGDWDWDYRIHYATRKGKELWNKKIWGATVLSPDGKMVVNYTNGSEGQDINAYDSQGKLLWTFGTNYVDALSFSSDSQFLGFQGDGYYLMDKSGNVLWKKVEVFASNSSISDMAKYVYLNTGRGKNEIGKVYDKQGNLVFEGKTRVSGDGNRLLVVYQDKMSILSLPDKTLLGEYSGGGFLSHDGRFLSTRTSYPSGDFRVMDTLDRTFSDIPVSMVNVSRVLSTKDGRYLILVVDGNKILYYQLY